MKIINVKTEYLDNPLGLDIVSPRITWNVTDCKKQVSFQIDYYINGEFNSTDIIESSSTNYRFKETFKSRDRVEFVIKCKSNNEECKSEDEIQKYLDQNTIYLRIYLESGGIDHNNQNAPLLKKYYQNDFQINSKNFINNIVLFWRKVIYKSNEGIIFNNFKEYNDFTFDAAIKDRELFSLDSKFFIDYTVQRFQFLMTVEYADSYLRNYTNFTGFLANFVAWFNLISIIAKLLNFIDFIGCWWV